MSREPNALIVQSGGPTAVINASLAGMLREVLDCGGFGRLLGARNGILGVLREELCDLSGQHASTIDALGRAPGAALGSCRYRLRPLKETPADHERILAVLRAHDVRCFFFIGGNDSMDTADKIGRLAADSAYELVCLGIPKTVDNDLSCTDHCPGYGSVAKFVATSAMEAGRDTEGFYTTDTCTILELMGRDTGWIAAATGLAARSPGDAPHLIYLPETPCRPEGVVRDVKEVLRELGRVFIVVGEGLKDADGNYLAADGGTLGTDGFGHRQLGGVAEALKTVIERELGVKVRWNKLGTNQRSAMHLASRTDVEEAWTCGRMAVRHARADVTGKMVTLIREPGETYRCSTGLVPLSEVANGKRPVPPQFINEQRNHVTDALRAYVRPLVQGQAPLDLGPDGLPVFVRLKWEPVQTQLARYKQ